MTRDYALELLGLSGTPDEDELKKAYRELAKRVHPDTGGNNALFKLVNEAYNTLSAEPQRPEKQQTTKTPWYKTASWHKLVTHPDFKLPFSVLSELCNTGIPQTVPFYSRHVTIRLQDLLNYPIKSEFPIRVTATTWKSWFHKLFRRKPISNNKAVLTVRNEAAIQNGPSHQFRDCIKINMPPGYQTIKLSFLNQQLYIKGWYRKNTADEKVFTLNSTGVQPVTIKIQVVLET